MNWNAYDADIRESFRKLREEKKLFDVTLVTDDGQHMQAHKIILSAVSNFFSDIFMKSNHDNMLVYLKGISSNKLESVIDFIYTGEAFIIEEQLNIFIETGKELQVKGLEGELTRVIENKNETYAQNSEYLYDDYAEEKVFSGSKDEKYNTATKMDKGNPELSTNNAFSLQINKMIEKNDGVWRCKICGKTTTKTTIIRQHAEIHIEGMSFACHICSKTYTSRHTLKCHISNIYSELFYCDICEKTGLNRGAYREHKRRHNLV